MGSFNLDTFSGLISEGENFSFILNKSTSGKSCIVSNMHYAVARVYSIRSRLTSHYIFSVKYGLLCHVQELLKILISGLETNIFEELELSQHVSEEEWETIKPSKSDRRESIISYIKVRTFAYKLYDFYKMTFRLEFMALMKIG